MVDADTADKHHLKIGDELRTIAVTGDFTAKIIGIATFKVTNPGAAVVYLDTATAQSQAARHAPACSPTSPSPPTPASATTQLKKNVAAALGDARVQGPDASRRPRTPTRTRSAPSSTS